jgi:phospholipid/cholesterol/gamma-HCH transport system substrate-binding protein
MRRAIRKHLRDFIAILFLVLVAAGTAGYILSNQRFYLPAWVPGIGTDFYTVEAEFETGQAVVPGQGQSVNIAGVKVGDIGEVELEDGVAVVELKIQDEHKPIYRDAKMLLRPKTGLKDMFVELDPGTQAAGELPEGGRIELAQTRPDVNPDEILAQLDGDTRAYLMILANAGGEAFTDDPAQPYAQSYAADLRETFKRFEPTNAYIKKFTGLLSERRQNAERAIHSFSQLAQELGEKDDQLAELVESSNANFQVFAEQEANLRRSLQLLPITLTTTRNTLAKVETLAGELGPTFESLRPFARNLGPALVDVRPALRATTPIIRDEIRPFTRIARSPTRKLRAAAEELAPTTSRINSVFGIINDLLNTLAYNPPGNEEGYLFWTAWANHAAAFVFNTQDAHGPVRRGNFLVDCASLAAVEGLVTGLPQLEVLFELLNAPDSEEVCAQAPTPSSAAENEKQAPKAAKGGFD